MVYLEQLGASPRARTSRLHLICLCLLSAGLLEVSGSCLHAAPITLRFEAVIGPPRQGMFPIELPFSFAEGDRISGAFTFEPHDAPSDNAQTLTTQNDVFRFEVQSFQIHTSRYELAARNNSTSDENPVPQDRIDLRCAFGGNLACSPPTIPGSQNIEWAFFAAFGGNSDVLDGPDLPANMAIWNQLLPGSLLVTFSDTAIQRSNGFIATIDWIQIVPEPSTRATIAIFCSIGTVVLILRDRRRKKTQLY